MNSAALAFEQVTKRFGSKIALAQFTLDVVPGESFALVGMNGAGKTTLLKCLLDFCEPDAGRISIFGVTHRETRSRARLSFLPERFTPPYFLTGRDFLRYMLKLQNVVYREEDARATLESLDLDRAALDLPVRAYSKGMTQKLGLAACFLSRKDLYVLDEPTSGLDPKARALLKLRLKGLRESGSTVFFTSHSLADVEEIGFAPPLERLEAFNTSGGTSTLPKTLLGKVRDLDYKTIRYPGHAAIMRTLFELGLMSSEPAEFRGVRVAPRDVLEPLIAANIAPTEHDIVLVRVTVDGMKGGRRARAVYEMVDRRDESTGLTAMMRGTAFPSAIVCLMMARGQTRPGATPQELALDLDAFIAEVRKRGLPLETSFEVF